MNINNKIRSIKQLKIFKIWRNQIDFPPLYTQKRSFSFQRGLFLEGSQYDFKPDINLVRYTLFLKGFARGPSYNIFIISLEHEEEAKEKIYLVPRLLHSVTAILWAAGVTFFRLRVHTSIKEVCPRGVHSAIGGKKRRNIITMGRFILYQGRQNKTCNNSLHEFSLLPISPYMR